jgi:hypothetical protein
VPKVTRLQTRSLVVSVASQCCESSVGARKICRSAGSCILMCLEDEISIRYDYQTGNEFVMTHGIPRLHVEVPQLVGLLCTADAVILAALPVFSGPAEHSGHAISVGLWSQYSIGRQETPGYWCH